MGSTRVLRVGLPRSPRLATGTQRLRPGQPLIIRAQEDINFDPKCACQAVQNVDRGVHAALLDATEVGRRDASIDGQLLLRQRPLAAQATKIPSEACPSIHGEHRHAA